MIHDFWAANFAEYLRGDGAVVELQFKHLEQKGRQAGRARVQLPQRHRRDNATFLVGILEHLCQSLDRLGAAYLHQRRGYLPVAGISLQCHQQCRDCLRWRGFAEAAKCLGRFRPHGTVVFAQLLDEVQVFVV
jgi:hypothetical protein